MDAYAAAKAGGPHQGLWQNYRDRPVAMPERAIRSLEQCIAEHQAKIARPRDFLRPDVPEIQVEHLVKMKWPEESDTFKAQIAVLKGIIEEKCHGGTD
jgi:hypothetical protein